MKKSMKLLTTAIVMTSTFAAGMAANNIVEVIQAEIHRDMTIIVDGKVQSFEDANGSKVYPILYNGTTYLPVRAIGNLMKKDVGWDGTTKTITLTSPTVDLGGYTIYDDEFLTLKFKETFRDERWSGVEYGIRFTLVNKTQNTIDPYLESISLNGISYNDFYCSDTIAANSSGIIELWCTDPDSSFATFPLTGVFRISGEFTYLTGEYFNYNTIKFDTSIN